MSLLRNSRTQLVREINTIHKVIVGADELWNPEVFSDVFAKNHARSTCISGSYSKAAALEGLGSGMTWSISLKVLLQGVVSIWTRYSTF